MVAHYTGHEDDFKNTLPLTIGALEEISSSFTLTLNYQCYNQGHAICTMQMVY
jgi:hypothetical protein